LVTVCCSVELIFHFAAGSAGYLILASTFSVLASLVALVMVRLEHGKVKRTPHVLTIYWLGLTAGGVFKFRTFILTLETTDAIFALYCVELASTLLLILLGSLPIEQSHYRALGDPENPSPESSANLFSTLYFWWLMPLLSTGHKRPLVVDDLWDLGTEEHADVVREKFAAVWKRELEKPHPSLLWALYRAFGKPFLIAGV